MNPIIFIILSIITGFAVIAAIIFIVVLGVLYWLNITDKIEPDTKRDIWDIVKFVSSTIGLIILSYLIGGNILGR